MNGAVAKPEKESLELKWGTLKGWNLHRPESIKALEHYESFGSSTSAMVQHDTPEQKKALCALIDAVRGKIWLDWDGKVVTKRDAKNYIMTYGES